MCTYVYANACVGGCGSQRSTIGLVPWEMSILLVSIFFLFFLFPEMLSHSHIAACGLGVRPGCWPTSPKDALYVPLQDWDRTFYATTPAFLCDSGDQTWVLMVV